MKKGFRFRWSAYCGNCDEAVEEVIDADPVAAAVRAVMAMRTEWTGTASQLLGALAKAAGERVAKSRTWPNGPQALAGRLRRAATFLRKVGIEVTFRREGRARIRIAAAPTHPAPECGGTRPSAPSSSFATLPRVNGSNDLAADISRTVANAADARPDDSGPVLQRPSAGNPLKSNGMDRCGRCGRKSGRRSLMSPGCRALTKPPIRPRE